MKASHIERCQVETPHDVVGLVWRIAQNARPGVVFDSVLDLGAGDGRFALEPGVFERYVGVERDSAKVARAQLPNGARLIVGDALDWTDADHAMCIGNPPYIRHHGLDPEWRDRALQLIKASGGPALKKTANAFVIFLAQSLLRTRDTGLVVQVVPYEWVTRPSAAELRAYIGEKGWNVQVYRFDVDIFPTVLTTASVTIIDKAGRDGRWTFGQIGRDGQVKQSPQPSGSRTRVLGYANREPELHALRGLSPGGQDIFVLNEQQRLYYGLHKRRDVRPCVVSLRYADDQLIVLDHQAFQSTYIRSGRPCWLIRSDRETMSPALQTYIDSVGERWKQYSTCTNRSHWWAYRPHPKPQLLVSSGFTKKAPKILINQVGAIAVGSVYGIVSDGTAAPDDKVAAALRGFDFQRRLVHHANNLKKLEVRQLNSVLNELFS